MSMPHRQALVQYFCRTTNLLPLSKKPSLKLNVAMPALKEKCLLLSSEQRDSELTSMVDHLPLSQTTRPSNPSPRRTWQTHQPTCSACNCASRDMITSSFTAPVRKGHCLTHSHFSPCPGPDIPLDIAIHHACCSPEQKEAFQQSFLSDPKMCAPANIIITSWPDDIKVVPCPLCPYWQHHETLTFEDGLVLHGEALIVPPLERERVLQQLHQFHQGITKAQLLTCGCIF